MGESRTQSVNVAARPKCTETALFLAIQHQSMGDSMALRLYCHFTHRKCMHTHPEGEREKREGGRGRLCPCGRMQLLFQSSHVHSCIIRIGSRILHSFLVPLAACRVSPNFMNLSKYRETAQRLKDRIKMVKLQSRKEYRQSKGRKMGKVKLEVRCASLKM